jgi:hypothetical protein
MTVMLVVLISLAIFLLVDILRPDPAPKPSDCEWERRGYDYAERLLKMGWKPEEHVRWKADSTPAAVRGAERAIANWRKAGWL